MEQLTESQAVAYLASQLSDGAQWCAHRTAAALHDPRILPHGHPVMWYWGRTRFYLAVAHRRGWPNPSVLMGEATRDVARDVARDRLATGSGGRLTEAR